MALSALVGSIIAINDKSAMSQYEALDLLPTSRIPN